MAVFLIFVLGVMGLQFSFILIDCFVISFLNPDFSSLYYCNLHFLLVQSSSRFYYKSGDNTLLRVTSYPLLFLGFTQVLLHSNYLQCFILIVFLYIKPFRFFFNCLLLLLSLTFPSTHPFSFRNFFYLFSCSSYFLGCVIIFLFFLVLLYCVPMAFQASRFGCTQSNSDSTLRAQPKSS